MTLKGLFSIIYLVVSVVHKLLLTCCRRGMFGCGGRGVWVGVGWGGGGSGGVGYGGIPFKIDQEPPTEKYTKESPAILILVHFTKDSPGKNFLQGNPL